MAKNTVFCDECKKQIDTRIKDFSFYSKILCSECTDKFDWNKIIDYYIFSEKNFKPEDRHLFVISFCSNCNKPKIMRKDKIIKGLEKYGYHLCDACNRSRQAKENLKELNGENRYKIHSTKACKDAYRKQALSNLEKINSEEGLQSRKDNGVFERAHKTRLENEFYDKFGIGYRFCKECNKETLHNGMVCKICHPEVIPGNPYGPPNVHKYTYNNNNRIVAVNDIPIEKWYSNIKRKQIYFLDKDFIIIPTGREQNSFQGNYLLDDYLVKHNITWFVYIKYDELGHPLVVGKSGSKLVNVSGCDVIFDKNSNGGPARQYLLDNNIDWDKTQIAIYKCNTEQEAYDKEKEIQEKYNLFGS